MLEVVPVEHGVDLVGCPRGPRHQIEVGRQLVRCKAANALLAQHAAPSGGEATAIASLRAAGRLHPAGHQGVEVHSVPVVANEDLSMLTRDAGELDRDARGIGIVRVLHELRERDDLVADQLGTDQLQEPCTRREGCGT
ncbi:hypothetical protein WME82_43765 [Sorangium sp. So ce128]